MKRPTTGTTRDDAVNRLEEIREKLSHLNKAIWMVYVLDNPNYDRFEGDNKLNLPQFKTRLYVTAEQKQKRQKTK